LRNNLLVSAMIAYGSAQSQTRCRCAQMKLAATTIWMVAATVRLLPVLRYTGNAARLVRLQADTT